MPASVWRDDPKAKATLLKAYQIAHRVVALEDDKACAYTRTHPQKDGWGRGFQVACQLKIDGLVIRSAGEDGRFQTDDDIVWVADPQAFFLPDRH